MLEIQLQLRTWVAVASSYPPGWPEPRSRKPTSTLEDQM